MSSENSRKRKLVVLSRRYQAVLREHLDRGSRSGTRLAHELGHRAMDIGLETLDLARIHEQALIKMVVSEYSTSARERMVRKAGTFFAEALTPIEKTHRTAREANAHLDRVNQTLRRRSVDLTTSNRHLKKEIVRRQAVEDALKKSQRHYSQLLEQSRRLQEQLRYLSRQILAAQEEERKRISRELHDEIAQTLTGINIELAALKTESTISTSSLQKKIASTQRLVERSVDIVHRFARELRPTVLDDLGLIPALHSFVRSFAKRNRIRVHLVAYSGVEQLNSAKRTVLYRVAQEALINVAKHARATQVDVGIQKESGIIRMRIEDNGRSFQVQRVLGSKRNRGLGLLGMRERMEMVGGRFSVESAPGKGTTIRAEMPAGNGRGRGKAVV